MRRAFVLIFIPLLLYSFQLYSQKKFCADSSIRVKYSFDQLNVSLFNNYDTIGTNIFVGIAPQNNNPIAGIIALKTNWGDSIYWLKKFYLNNIQTSCLNSFDAPAGTIITSGFWANSDVLFSRIDTNGNLQWARRYRLSQSHSGTSSLRSHKNILVTNNAIYANFYFSGGATDFFIVAKLDLNGNILWSKSLKKNIGAFIDNTISDAPVLYNDTLLIMSNVVESSNTGIVIKRYPVITKLKDTDGSVLESIAYKTLVDNTVKGIIPQYFKLNKDTTFSVTGSMSIPQVNNGQPSLASDLTFHLTLDKDLQPVYSSYYKPSNLLFIDGQNFNFDFSASNQAAFLYNVFFSNDKYFVTFDKNRKILRSRKLLLPPLNTARYSVNFDDKQNIHFTYNYSQNNKSVVEYARISDLAAANTVTCFGKDTSIIEPQTFTILQEPFSWDMEYTNIVSSFSVNFLEETEIITKELVCKQVSYCDSIKIKGKSTICLATNDVRYSVYQNPECMKGIVWQTDTTLVTVVNNEADTAITLRPKKEGQFYLKATVNNCVVTDSMLVTVIAPLSDLQLNRDSLLCPGSSIVLSVNPLYNTYQWQDGSTKNTYTVTSPGLYRIIATDNCGNTIKDSIQVTLVDTSLDLLPLYAFCVLDSIHVLLPSDVNNIRWQPSSDVFLRSNELVFFPKQPTAYTITAVRPPGCTMKQTINLVEGTCPDWIRFPSAFTPNNDGLNDKYKAIVSGQLSTYNLKIFNRYGSLIFNSNNPYSGWDGKLKNVTQSNGVYVYISRYKFANGKEHISKGTIMLIK